MVRRASVNKQSTQRRRLAVRAHRDDETGGWWADSEDIPGLITEAPTFDELVERVRAVVPELCELNGITLGARDVLQFQRDTETANMTESELSRALSELGLRIWNAVLSDDAVMDALHELADVKLALDDVDSQASKLTEDAAVAIFQDETGTPNLVRPREFVPSADWARNSHFSLALRWVLDQAIARMTAEQKFASEVGKARL
jgi:hypothetical protein